MSERLNSTSINSNEEIIDDLTKDLKSSLVTDEFVINPSSSTENTTACAGDGPSSTNNAEFENIPLEADLDADHKEAKEEKSKEDASDVSSDEESLKDAEVDLTEDEKEERKIIAEELKSSGNDCFKLGEYDRSADKYTRALEICPLQYPQQRAVLYCNRSAARFKLNNYKSAIKDCTKAVALDDKYMKAYWRRAMAYEATEKLDESLADFKKVLELDPSHKEAKAATVRLPPKIEEKNEKLKTEMMGKLKDLGNMILKPFGLSTENFQLEQDPESKGYKINFKQ